MNPRAPQIHATVKLYKQDKPTRPIVNWKHSSAYNLTKHINVLLNKMLSSPNVCNVRSSYSLTQSLANITIDENTRLCSFDIDTSIPTMELKSSIKDILNNDPHKKEEEEELMHLLSTMLEQNYIEFNKHFFKQNEGLAMGAPTSAILAQVFV